MDGEEGSAVSEFEFNLDRDRRLLTVTIHGFGEVQIYRAYDARLRVELAGLKRLPAPRACLVDARDFAIQSMEVANLMREGVTERLALYPERTVRLVARAISHAQAARMINHVGHRVFDDIEPAMDWLLGRDSQPGYASAGGAVASG
jgi:hypothetical protein